MVLVSEQYHLSTSNLLVMLSADKAQICGVWMPACKTLNGWLRLCFDIALWLPSVLLVQYTGLNVTVIFDVESAK
jgi:hypothetical protein